MFMFFFNNLIMTDESPISSKTWARTADSISKVGYMDGAADGQLATFQSSFDAGYKQGLQFGLELGNKEAVAANIHQHREIPELRDPRKINCQICLNNTLTQGTIVHLFDIQKERNEKYLTDMDDKVNV